MKNYKTLAVISLLLFMVGFASAQTTHTPGLVCKHINTDTGVSEVYYYRAHSAPTTCPGYVHNSVHNQVNYTWNHLPFSGPVGPGATVTPAKTDSVDSHNCKTTKFVLPGT